MVSTLPRMFRGRAHVWRIWGGEPRDAVLQAPVMRRVIVLVVLLCVGGPAHAQPAQRRQEAAEHFNRATTAEKDGRYEDAIREYELAYSLVPHANTLYNIGFNYEKLEDLGKAADYYQRYLDERASANDPPDDAEAVRAKIRDLRARATAAASDPPPPPSSTGTSLPQGQPFGGAGGGQPPEQPAPPIARPPVAAWHGGLSVGLGFGDTPVQRYLAHGGIRIAQRIDADAILGGFGKNDHALGVMTRLLITRSPVVASFARAAVTIGYAKQDASSTAETRFPFGLEAGGGVQIGAKGKVEVDAIVRWVRGGWDAESTPIDSYVNDDIAFAIDVGFVVDLAAILGARPN